MTPTIEIYGTIGDAENGTTTKSVSEALKRIGDDVEEITVLINSDGGSVSQGVAIAGMFRNHPAQIHTIVEGGCFSIASYIAMAGDVRSIASDAIFHTHGPQLSTSGNLADHEDSLKELRHATRVMAERFAEVSNEDIDDIVAGFSRDRFFDAHEAVEAGYMTNVLEASNVTASVNPDQFESIPHRFAVALAGKRNNSNSRGSIMAKPATTPAKSTAKAASPKELRKAFPNASADFLFAQAESEATIQSATAAYVKELEKENTALRAQAKATAMEDDEEMEAMDEEEIVAEEEDEEPSKLEALKAKISALFAEYEDEEVTAEMDEEVEAIDEEEEAADAKARANAYKASRNGQRTGAKALSTVRAKPKTSAVAELNSRIEKRMAAVNGLSRAKAQLEVFSEDPEFHDRYMAEACKPVESNHRNRKRR